MVAPTDLFAQPVRYPESPGFSHGRETSRKAAETVRNPGKNERLVIDALISSDMTDYEIAEYLDMAMARIQPRRSTLTARGLVIDSGVTRLTPYGKKAVVWRLAHR